VTMSRSVATVPDRPSRIGASAGALCLILHQTRLQFVDRLIEGESGRIEYIQMARVVFEPQGLPELAQGYCARFPFIGRHVPIAVALPKLERRSMESDARCCGVEARDRQAGEIPADSSMATPRMVEGDMIDEHEPGSEQVPVDGIREAVTRLPEA